MGRQVNFYVLPNDTRKLHYHVQQVGGCGIADACVCGLADIVSLDDPRTHDPSHRMYFVRNKDILRIVCEHPDECTWRVDSLRSPVLEFTPGYFDGQILRHTRLYFQPGYFDNNGHWVEKPEEFQKWADRLLRWIRTHYCKHPEVGWLYVGPEAWQWVNEQHGLLSIN